MKIRINTKKLKSLNPCQDRLDNWLKYYNDFNDDIVKFLQLNNITVEDKIWVALKLLPKSILEVFAIDCALVAEKYADAVSATAYAAAYAADSVAKAAYTAAEAAAYAANTSAYNVSLYAANNVAAYVAERNNQVEALIYLIKSEGR